MFIILRDSYLYGLLLVFYLNKFADKSHFEVKIFFI